MGFDRKSWSAALVIPWLVILDPTSIDAAELICGRQTGEAVNVRIEMLDRTRQHGGLREEFDGLTLHAVRCTVGGVLDAVAEMAATSWSGERPHPYVLVKGTGDAWRNANDVRGERLVEGARFYYPLMGRWRVTFGASAA